VPTISESTARKAHKRSAKRRQVIRGEMRITSHHLPTRPSLIFLQGVQRCAVLHVPALPMYEVHRASGDGDARAFEANNTSGLTCLICKRQPDLDLIRASTTPCRRKRRRSSREPAAFSATTFATRPASATIVVFNRPIVRLRAPVLGVPVDQRAKNASDRIRTLLAAPGQHKVVITPRTPRLDR
jgi:hypothetical protein